MKNLLSTFLFLGGAAGLQTIKKDVVIVGGGSSGIYTGISLMDKGKDVVIIEKSDIIGSHANTYYDPVSKTPRNVGVQSLHNVSVVRDYLTRLNVTAGPYISYSAQTTLNVDYITGLEVKNYIAPNISAVVAGWEAFRSIIQEKYGYLDDGFFLPDPVPKELLMPFSEFSNKYGFDAILPSLATVIEPVEVWKESTLYVIKNFGIESIDAQLAFATSGGFVPRDVNDIYFSAAKILGSRVLLNSTVQSVKRSNDGVTVVVKTPTGRICYEADKIIMAAPPLIRNFAGWDLSSNEAQLFGKFQSKNTHIGITRNPEWNNVNINGVGPSYASTTARLPGTVSTTPTGFSDSSYYSYICFIGEASVQHAQTLYQSEIKKLIANGVLPESKNEIVEWFNHNQYMNYVSNDDIKAGFYTKLNNLQGTSSTYYVGAAWAGQDSSYIWGACKRLLPKLLA
ncbi:hypothetical protein BKA64DRAFT_125488 [Cadophora sp. MPI-SDFR-AT-0126]|nr:hypothetical protein BKA64DRAFT_125488 [Leotiomycetes sp. MPI-SDFR-AT-0126]